MHLSVQRGWRGIAPGTDGTKRKSVRAIGALICVAVLLTGCGQSGPESQNGTVTAAPSAVVSPSALATSATGMRFLGYGDPTTGTTGFARALKPRAFKFPLDYGSHPKFRTEWWYFTGNVRDLKGRHFGFDLTLFRYALAATPPQSPSPWATNQMWMANMAVTNSARGQFIAAQRLSRGAMGLAGSEAQPFRIWVEGWSVTRDAASGVFTLHANHDDTAFTLTAQPMMEPVPNGNHGLSQKGPQPGNASYYYSIPRLAVTGTITVAGQRHQVRGEGWLDREWSTSALDRRETGWDWFALQFKDGRALMFYRLRRDDGSASPLSGGSLYLADGGRKRLAASSVELHPTTFWTSPSTGVRYPVGWNLRIPGEQLQLQVRAFQPNQEINLLVRYWEGAVTVTGTSHGDAVSGQGYLELAGYAAPTRTSSVKASGRINGDPFTPHAGTRSQDEP